ncbi:NUDIX hydrolase [Photobacterium leiognathi]|uniref:NUDIX hydrolase n=1 Tax=Photobacterium leiognathi TaxID=553611 RepID=UPI0029812BE4|nr:NUDIX domain-containing protein [Photobacterium leiognathi]
MSHSQPCFCPQCGQKTLSQCSAKQFVCTHCQFTYFHNPAAAVMVAIIVEDELLIAIRGREPGLGGWDLPGGFVDPDESLEQAAVREIQEELGLTIGTLHYQGSFSNTYCYKNVEYKTCDTSFICQLPTKPTLIAQDDVAEVMWVNKRNIELERFAFPSTRQAVSQWLQQ